MATTPKPARADDPDSFQARDERLGAARGTDCAACHAPLPAGNRYLCAACVAESAGRARAILDSIQVGGNEATGAEGVAAVAPDSVDADDSTACPTCGMRLDASGRCAVCVTTVRR
jgi:hypothetical protein